MMCSICGAADESPTEDCPMCVSLGRIKEVLRGDPINLRLEKGKIPPEYAERLFGALQISWSVLDRIVTGHGVLITQRAPMLAAEIDHARYIVHETKKTIELIDSLRPSVWHTEATLPTTHEEPPMTER